VTKNFPSFAHNTLIHLPSGALFPKFTYVFGKSLEKFLFWRTMIIFTFECLDWSLLVALLFALVLVNYVVDKNTTDKKKLISLKLVTSVLRIVALLQNIKKFISTS
jgi:hypothetical protein